MGKLVASGNLLSRQDESEIHVEIPLRMGRQPVRIIVLAENDFELNPLAEKIQYSIL
jgi:hypothetical protein